MARPAHKGLMILDCVDPDAEHPLDPLKIAASVYAPLKQMGLKTVALASFGPSSVFAREFYHRNNFTEHDRPRIVQGPARIDVQKVCERLSAEFHMPHDRCIFVTPAIKYTAGMNLEAVEKLGMQAMVVVGAAQDTGEPACRVYNGNIGPISFLAPPSFMYATVEEMTAGWRLPQKPPGSEGHELRLRHTG